jgi:hypothetical protein
MHFPPQLPAPISPIEFFNLYLFAKRTALFD